MTSGRRGGGCQVAGEVGAWKSVPGDRLDAHNSLVYQVLCFVVRVLSEVV